MGADIYRDDHEKMQLKYQERWSLLISQRNSLPDGDTKERVQAEIERVYEEMYKHPYYFRDSYNSSSLFWKIGLSWWGDIQQYFGPNGDGKALKYDENTGDKWIDCRLYPIGIRKLEAAIRERSELLAYNIKDLGKEEQDYFFQKYDQLLDFLKQAADDQHTIYCSV